MQHLLPPVAQYFKANLHSHTTLSDGRMTPQEVKDAYRAGGYSILCLTDHNLAADHSDMNEPDFLMLTGLEINTSQVGFHPRMQTYHLNLIAKRPDLVWQPFPRVSPKEEARPYVEKAQLGNMSNVYDIDAVNSVIAEANRQGYLVSYNHPDWCLHSYPDYAPLKGLWAMELCNNGCSMIGNNDRDNAKVYRDFANLGNRIMPLGTDDCHSPRDLFGAWTMIGAEKLDYASVIDAMEKGDLYASTGPEIYDLTLDGGALTVRCSDARFVTLETSTRFARRVNAQSNDGLLREAAFDLTPWLTLTEDTPNDWFRLVIHGPYGHYAATRAYFRDELK